MACTAEFSTPFQSRTWPCERPAGHDGDHAFTAGDGHARCFSRDPKETR